MLGLYYREPNLNPNRVLFTVYNRRTEKDLNYCTDCGDRKRGMWENFKKKQKHFKVKVRGEGKTVGTFLYLGEWPRGKCLEGPEMFTWTWCISNSYETFQWIFFPWAVLPASHNLHTLASIFLMLIAVQNSLSLHINGFHPEMDVSL